MMFSRQDLGRLFKEDDEPQERAGAAASKGGTNIPRLPIKSEELAFKPLVEQQRRVVRYRAGQAPTWGESGGKDAEDDEIDGLQARASAPAAVVTHSSGSSGSGVSSAPRLTTSRPAFSGEIIRAPSHSTAHAPAGSETRDSSDRDTAPPRRRVVEAAVIVKGSSDGGGGHGSSGSGSGSGGSIATAAADADDTVRARQERAQRLLAARRAAEGGEPSSSEGVGSTATILRPYEHVQGDVPVAPTAANTSATAAASSSAASSSSSAGAIAASASEAPREEDAEARRARIRERLKQRKVEQEQEQTAPVPAPAPAPAPASDLPSGGSSAVARTRQPVEAAVIKAGSSAAVAPSAAAAGPLRMTAAPKPQQAAAESEDDSEEEEEDSSEEGGDEAAAAAWNVGRRLFKPVFRSKEQRVTLRQAEAQAAEEDAAREAAAAASAAARAAESRQMVVDQLRQEEAAAVAAEADAEDKDRPDDTDKPEERDADIEAWQLRELKRLKRDTEARAAAAAEVAETERRRKLTPEERAAEDAILAEQGLRVFRKDKEKWKFMQKYYHKGAFFMDESSVKTAEDVRARSYAAPTGEDTFDRAAMPAVMQVKKFGFKGRTKWTHLAAEDTLAPTFKEERLGPTMHLQRKLDGLRGGMHGDDI